MMSFYWRVVAFSCVLAFAVQGCGDSDGGDGSETVDYRVVRLFGTAVGVETTVPDIDGDGEEDEATCFELAMLDAVTGTRLGTATDCLSNITEEGDGLALTATTTFEFDEGTVVARGETTVQPTTIGSPDVTHITGGIPTAGENGIIDASGDYEDASGAVRLSGAVNLSRLESDGEISFDCLFVLELESEAPSSEDAEYRVLRLDGTGTAVETTVPDIDGDGEEDEATCFELPMFELPSGERVGTATDCLSNITEEGDGLALTATTTFDFGEDQAFTARGLTSVQPTTIGSDDFTHITGAIPTTSENSILSGSGDYESLSGPVRLSGAVNLSRLESDGEIDFDCLFVVPAGG